MKRLLPAAAGIFLIVGCTPTLVPHTPYLPMLRDKGQIEARISTGLKGEEMQLGYQATKRLVLHVSGLRYERADAGKSFRSADVGLGYYWPLANGQWRLGLHGGVARGKGTAEGAGQFCDGCQEVPPSFRVSYSYLYVQPTALLLNGAEDRWSAGAALRLGWAHYQQLDELNFDLLGNPTTQIDHSGHQAVFLQPMLQQNFRVLPWLALSSSTGFQFYVGPRNTRLNRVYPLVAQVGLHFIIGSPQPAGR